MIQLNFFLFYSGSKLPYLRYLCFKTLRHFHPNSKIQLYTTDKYKTDDHNWSREKQDFETELKSRDYLKDLKDLDVEIMMLKDFLPNFNPVVQSDVFRYLKLHKEGGIYLDTDQIILNSFETLPLEYDLLYSRYFNPQCGPYSTTGVLACTKEHPVMDFMVKNIMKYYRPNNYNSTGPWSFADALNKAELRNAFNVPSIYWYPIFHSDLVGEIYSGSFQIPKVSLAMHWFAGHQLSQDFNRDYTEEFAKTSKDSISSFLREKGLI